MHTIRKIAVVLVLSAISTLGHGQSSAMGAPVPNLVRFAGTLKDSGGHPIRSITGVTFSLYAQEQGGTALWLETQNVQADARGNYTAQLGATKPAGLPLELFTSGTARWLGVRINGGEEQPRILLLSVPYALKAADSQTLGGLPPSAFMLAAPTTAESAISSTAPSSQNNSTAAVSGTGTTDFVPLWTNSTGALGNSILFQSGTGTTMKVGVNTTTPAATLDVNGTENVHSTLNHTSTGVATATAGKNSAPDDFSSSVFNSAIGTVVPQKFRWQAEPVGNNTASASAVMSLLHSTGTLAPAETGLKINSKGQISFASGQTFPGTGTITGVTAGAGLLGGGAKGTVALSVDSSQVPLLAAQNNFSRTQAAFVDGGIGLLGESTSSEGVYGSSSSSNGVTGVSSTGTGSYGQSTSGIGVYGSSPNFYGVAGVTTSGNGVYGQVSTANQAGVVGRQEDSSGNWGIYAFGNIGASGTKSSVVAVDNGTRQVALYAVESPGVWFEDYGSGKLVSGVATVTIDPVYAQTVNTGVTYHVFLTPDGDCEGLYVSARTATSFEVRELHKGTSSVAFDYRIIALRRGYETKRLADVTRATPRAAIETPRLMHAGSTAGIATAK